MSWLECVKNFGVLVSHLEVPSLESWLCEITKIREGQYVAGQNKDLKSNVEEWLSKEGYSLEFSTANVFRRAGFKVSQGQYVRDSVADTARDIDVSARRDRHTENVILRIENVVECKWSKDRPWVIFSSNDPIPSSACIAQTIGSDLGQNLLWLSSNDPFLHGTNHFYTPERPGFSGRQALNSGKDLFYSAMQSVTSTASLLAKQYDFIPVPPFTLPKLAVIVFPVIVVQGQLFEAFYDEGNEKVILEQVGRMRLHWRGSESYVLNATVDIVSADDLDAFANERASEVTKVLDSLEGSFNLIDECYKTHSLNPIKELKKTSLPPLLNIIKLFEQQHNQD